MNKLDCIRERNRKSTFAAKDFKYCPNCHAENRNPNKVASACCHDCNHRIDFRTRVGFSQERLNKLKIWCRIDNNKNVHAAKTRIRDRLNILKKVGRGSIKCVNCGCDDYRIIEINHINGGGTKEKNRTNRQFFRDILNNHRTIDDLNLLCRVCNAEHFINLKFGIKNFKIIYAPVNS